MRPVAALLALLFTVPVGARTVPAFTPQNTYALIVGVLSFKDPHLGSFSAAGRKDQAFYDTLRQRGVPANQMRLLLDAQATLAGIRSALTSLASQAKPGSTLIIYYAGHGVLRKGGLIYFANHDLDTKRAGSTGLNTQLFADIVTRHFRGRSVWLFADCCYSGALKRVAAQIARAGFGALSLTSADSSNISTGNWTFTQTIVDAFRGDPYADLNRDGQVSLREMARAVSQAMKYWEFQMYGYALHGVDQTAIISPSLRRRPVLTGPFRNGQYAFARLPSGWAAVRIVGRSTKGYLCRTYKYNRNVDTLVSETLVKPATFRHYPPGQFVQVRWQRRLWKAKILKRVGDFHLITYPGWPSYWDEWVMSNRIFPVSLTQRPQLSGAALVEWRGRWYPARVLKRSGDRYLIHYLGYASSWDEWVGPKRIRLPKQP